ncbi:MAG: AAA family ATPase, partial [Chloroflexota bacterium]
SARSLAQASRAPYFVWKSLWHNRFGLSQNDPPEVACEKFVRGVQMLWGRQLGQVSAVEAAHFVGALIGLEWLDSPFLAQPPGPARANRAYEFTRELLKRACATGPTILLLDDLHWADSGSLDLLEHVLEPADDSLPLFILGAVRPGILRQYRNLANAAVVITLKPLPTNPHLVAEAYPAIQNLPEPTLSEIARVSEGNPYFMEEMVKTLLQSHSTGNGQAAADERAVQLPDSLHAMLQARLDSLSADARGVALLASVVGRVFWTGAILAAAHQSTGTGLLRPHLEALENVVSTGLAELVRAELAFPRAGSMFAGEQEYIFKHSLLRDVAYSLLPLKFRRLYHTAVAQWLGKFAT